MILTKVTENAVLITSSTKESAATEYKFIASNTVTNTTVQLTGSITSSTSRFDRIPLQSTGAVEDIGYWDYLLVDSEFTGSFGDIDDIQLNYPQYVVERGKMLVTNESGKVPRTSYDGQTTTRVTYNG